MRLSLGHTPAKPASNTLFQRLGIRQWWFLAFTLIVALPIVLGLIFMDPVYAWYVEYFVEPGIERSLGFKGGEITLHRRPFAWFGIVSVSPGSPFERAGVRPGDLAVGYMHGARVGLMTDLQAARGRSINLHILNREACETGDYRAREIQVAVPRE